MRRANIAGFYRKNLSGEAEYQSFVPSPLPPDIIMDYEITSLLAEAHHKLGLLEGLASQIPDINIFMAMYVRKEALMSSQIEGTQATLEDILDPKAESNADINVIEVVNYVAATETAIKLLKTLPLCGRLMRRIHLVLMSRTRGEEKNPGEFRHTQNWIGGAGSTLRTAKYIPPNPDDMNECMSSLEKYINADDDTDELIKIALIHYQFETIHPFLDGNGRVGRLFIILYLMEKKILTLPALYISYYLKANRIEYYDRMTEVRVKGNYKQWIKFFLRAIIESSENAISTINELSELHKRDTARIKEIKQASKTTLQVFGYLEEHPITTIKGTASALNLSFNTVSSAFKRLCAKGILSYGDKFYRGRIFYYKEYIEILRHGTE